MVVVYLGGAAMIDRDPMIDRFLRFHAENPDVYLCLLLTALNWALNTPATRVTGMDLIAGKLRWEMDIKTSGAFKIDNDYLPFYARLLMARNEQLDGRFRTRASVADTDDTWLTEADDLIAAAA